MEDPFHPTVNMASPLATAAAFDFFLQCLRQTHLYFWIPQTQTGSVFLLFLLFLL